MYLRGPDHLKSGVVDFLGHSGESDYESHTKFVLDMIEKRKFIYEMCKLNVQRKS